MSTTRPLVHYLLAVLLVVVLGGCGKNGPNTAPVTGTVKLDGKPVAGAAVLFSPKAGGRPASGVTDETGSFALTTLEPRDGALLGEHTVVVTLVKSKGPSKGDPSSQGLSGAMDASPAAVQWIVPAKYANPQTSGLTANVQPGMEPVVLELKSR
jgi:hypothetical protein